MDRRVLRRGRGAIVLAALIYGAIAIGAAWAEPDAAKDYPNRPIHLVLGFGAGGVNDLLARVAGQKLSEILKQPVVIDNRPGAAGGLAAQFVAKAEPDGYTLMSTSLGPMVINPAVYTRLAYDTSDFVPIAEIAQFPMAVIVRADSPIMSVAELVAYAKGNPAKANYASASLALQVATELFKLRTGAPMERLAYKSSGESVLAVMSGAALCAFVDVAVLTGPLQAGQVRALALAAPHRLREFPDVPTLEETGVKDANVLSWSGIFAPKGTPPGIVRKLAGAAAEAVRSPDTFAQLKKLSVEPSGVSGDEFARRIDEGVRQAREVARLANIKIEQ